MTKWKKRHPTTKKKIKRQPKQDTTKVFFFFLERITKEMVTIKNPKKIPKRKRRSIRIAKKLIIVLLRTSSVHLGFFLCELQSLRGRRSSLCPPPSSVESLAALVSPETPKTLNLCLSLLPFYSLIKKPSLLSRFSFHPQR